MRMKTEWKGFEVLPFLFWNIGCLSLTVASIMSSIGETVMRVDPV